MHRKLLTGERLAACFLLGMMLFNYPILSLFDLPLQIAGIPLVYAYIFGSWLGLIVLMAWIIERRPL